MNAEQIKTNRGPGMMAFILKKKRDPEKELMSSLCVFIKFINLSK